MKHSHTGEGLRSIEHPSSDNGQWEPVLVQESARERHGEVAMWVGHYHRLSRTEVAELVAYLQHWLETGRLFEDVEAGK